jgi:nucleotide-binding universal stress UspA family protein
VRGFTRILCPVEFSDVSRHALEHAALFARWYDAPVTALFVYSPVFASLPGPGMHAFAAPTVVDRIDRADYERAVQTFARLAGASGVEVSPRVEFGVPAQEIVKVATTLPADLVVIGTRGAVGFEHFVLGSITEKVLRTCPVPVLTVPVRVRATSQLPFKRVLCPIDFSEPSRTALHLALSIAEEGDADLTILHILDGPTDEPLTTRHFSVPEFRREYERWAADELQALVPASVRDWCRPTTRVSHGTAHREILRIAGEDSADVIVMGMHGRSPLDLMVFGSTTNQVVRGATCPVLTVRA